MKLCFQDDKRKDVRQNNEHQDKRREFEWECGEQDSDGDVLQKQMCWEPQGCGQTLGSIVGTC